MAKHKHVKQDTGFEDGFKIGLYFGAYNPELAKEMIDEYRTRLRSEHNRDYKPVVHGHWIVPNADPIDMMFMNPRCSECGFESADHLNYCSNCKADMREADNERTICKESNCT